MKFGFSGYLRRESGLPLAVASRAAIAAISSFPDQGLYGRAVETLLVVKGSLQPIASLLPGEWL